MIDRLKPAVLDFKPQEILDPFEHFASLDFYKEQNVRLLNALHLQNGDKVLDLACGPGNLSVGIAEAIGSDGMIVAVDMSEVALAAAKKNLNGVDATVHYLQAEGGSIGEVLAPLAGKFDSVVCGNALHNFPNKLQTFYGINKLLKSGGVFAFNSTFWEGAIPEAEESFYTRWLRHASKRALEVSKENGIPVKEKERVEARKQITPEEWLDQFKEAGLIVTGFSIADVPMPLEGFTAISLDSEFVNGTMHRFRSDVASKSLQETVPGVFEEMQKEYSLRKWLQVSAVK